MWGGCGIALVGLMCATAVQGYLRSVGHPAGESAYLRIALAVAGGVFYFMAILARPRGRAVWGDVVMLLVVAAAMRAPLWSVPRVPMSDSTRYLWDGAVTASGVSPYRYAPADVTEGEAANTPLAELPPQALGLLDEINHPHLRTIYPPFAQALFALAYWLTPLELTGWRVVLLAFDALGALVALALLRRTGLSLAWWVVYLWNPLLVYETYGACHLDITAAAMVGLFAWALVRRRGVLAAVALGLGAGIKLWPILLIFFLRHAAGKNYGKLVLSVVVFLALTGAMIVPYAAAFGPDTDSGLTAYAKIWEWKPGAFLLLDKLGWRLRSALHVEWDGRYIARAIVMLILVGAAGWLGLRRTDDSRVLCWRIGIVVILTLLVGPTLWPWYYLPVIPLAAAADRRWALLGWTLLLPLSYLPRDALGEWTAACILHLPIWTLLCVEVVGKLVARSPERGESRA